MRRSVLGGVVLLAGAVLAGVPAATAVMGEPPSPAERADFDADGFADLAIGVPGEDVGTTDSGAVNVLYGSAAGLTATGNQLFSQDSPGVGDVPDYADKFGYSLAAGDFNGDGYGDLGIGIPFEEHAAGLGDSGAVQVLYGGEGGLAGAGSQFLHQDRAGVEDVAENFDYWGWSLAAGDFNGDGIDELAVGVPGEWIGGLYGAGGVNVLSGTPEGLRGGPLFHQDTTGILEDAGETDQFGQALAAGNVGGGPEDDLAVGVPHENAGAVGNAGGVHVLYGSATGLTATGNQFWDQASPDVEDGVESDDFFGSALAIGDFGGSAEGDLAIGVPFEHVGEVPDAGAVNVLYGSAGGLTSAGDQFWTQDSPGVESLALASEEFGGSLAAADFGFDGHADLAIGVPAEDPGPMDAGAVNVLFGSSGGLSSAEDEYWNQDTPGVKDAGALGDRFAKALFGADFNGDDIADLAVGVFSEDTGGNGDAGAVAVLPGTASGLSASTDQFWHQDSPHVKDVVEYGEAFGTTVA